MNQQQNNNRFQPQSAPNHNYNQLQEEQQMPEINIKKHQVNLRQNFITKVYSLLFIQLLITFGSIIFFNHYYDVHHFLKTTLGRVLFYVALVLSIALICSMTCCNLARKFPTNYVLLFSFTACESFLVTMACSRFPMKYIVMASLLTLAMTLTLTIYAWTTKTDFTAMGAILSIALTSLIVLGILTCFIHLPILHLVYNYLGVLLFSIYIIHDTQLIIGNHSYALSEDDYVFAVLMLYLDILNLFLHILEIMGSD